MNGEDVKETDESRDEHKQEETQRREEGRGTSVSLLKLNAMCGEQMGHLADSSAKDDTTKGATFTHTNTYTET